MFKIISRKEYRRLKVCEEKLALRIAVEIEARREGEVLNCGAKSCQFQTTDPRGLSIHRARMH